MIYAEFELEIYNKSQPGSVISEFTPEILALVKKFGESGQSGGSAPFVANALSETIKKLCLYQPIAPLTGIEEEWMDCARMGDENLYQNKRESGVFKIGKDGRPYYIDAIIKKTQSGSCWAGGGFWLNKDDYLTGNLSLKIYPKGYIKSFPFTPKTFYIDVIEEEVAKDDWEMWCKDPKQLEEVWEYYDKYE